MKTKFILHGGILKRKNPQNNSFFKECSKDLTDGDKILFIGFARPNIEEECKSYERDKGLILAQTNKKIVVENAKRKTLIAQIKESKVIFITGGNTQELQLELERQNGFVNALKGKVLAGSSAGALICATYYYGCTPKKVLKGMGMLPIRLMVHYGNPKFNATDETLKSLEAYPKDLELLAIPECEWRVREVEL